MSRPPFINILHEQERRRKQIIKSIQKLIKGKLICYIANPNVSPNFIDHNDIKFLNDLLQSLGHTQRLILMVNSPGGEQEVAGTLCRMFRDSCDEFRVIVPSSAMSAATLIALASDVIMMGYLSNIGPIDPQIRVVSPRGDFQYVPAQSYIDSFRNFLQMMTKGNIPPTALVPSLQQLSPPILDVCIKALESSKRFAEEWLSKYMLRDNTEKAKEIANVLADNNRWLTHGKNIDRDMAESLGLKIEKIPRDSELWRLIWDLYCRQEHFLNATQNVKIYENEKFNLNLAISVMVTRAQQQPAAPPSS